MDLEKFRFIEYYLSMKVCIINNIYPPYHRGGAEQVVKRAVDGLLERGHEVVLITSTPEKDSVEQFGRLTIYRKKPFNVYFYTDAHKHNVLMRLLWHKIDIFQLQMAHWVKNVIKEENPDIIHTHNLMGLSFLIPRVIRRLGKPHIHTVHDVQLVEPSGLIIKQQETSWRYNGFPTKLYTWLMKFLIKSPLVIISPSQFLLDFYTSRGFFPDSQKEVVRNPLTVDGEVHHKKSDNDFHFLYIGQIEKHKGIFTLVEAFKHVKGAKLHILGSGSQEKTLREMTRENEHIILHGFVKREDLPEFFSKIDMTVVPSLCYENSPTVIFESFYFGIPVLASEIEGVAELIDGGENGLTFCAGDVVDLEKKITWCIKHQQEVQRMSSKTKTALQRLISKDYITRLTELYSQAQENR
ncbi:glycosyltransferase family 4 protein [Candidatus Nomurabacteria bacterium]|nr:glycosyltransferase family 4 protein [Candidatus Nomurabacteria bacterium]